MRTSNSALAATLATVLCLGCTTVGKVIKQSVCAAARVQQLRDGTTAPPSAAVEAFCKSSEPPVMKIVGCTPDLTTCYCSTVEECALLNISCSGPDGTFRVPNPPWREWYSNCRGVTPDVLLPHE